MRWAVAVGAALWLLWWVREVWRDYRIAQTGAITLWSRPPGERPIRMVWLLAVDLAFRSAFMLFVGALAVRNAVAPRRR